MSSRRVQAPLAKSSSREGIVFDLDGSLPTQVTPKPPELIDAIKNKTASVGVIGLGYVGLPLVHAFSDAGFRVTGFDIDPEKVKKLLAGQSYIKHIQSEQVAKLISQRQFQPTTDFSKLREVDA